MPAVVQDPYGFVYTRTSMANSFRLHAKPQEAVNCPASDQIQGLVPGPTAGMFVTIFQQR